VFKLPGVTHVRSSVVLKEVKSDTRLPIQLPGKPPRAKAARQRQNA
jgi:Lrp/AsnC family transcriptional regulator, leucine-responsive regulatory protein